MEIYVVAQVSTRFGPSHVCKVVLISKCWVRSSGEMNLECKGSPLGSLLLGLLDRESLLSQLIQRLYRGGDSRDVAERVPFPVPERGFYTRRSEIVYTSTLIVVGMLERTKCMTSSSTEAPYVHQSDCLRGTLVNTASYRLITVSARFVVSPSRLVTCLLLL
ncbi:hypothetical protein GW17_00014338 [Ensete ventricosum]|nr:hypothetical protein GW17_00014338 [Ensete ventricosum]